MEPEGGIFDPDLDNQPRRPSLFAADPVHEYQRLVANPFLTVLAWVIFLGLLRGVVPRQEAAGLVADIVIFGLALLLAQYHCLDCGATGWLVRHQRHACPKVMIRWQNQIVRRFQGPGLGLQLVGWFIVTITAIVLGALAFGSSR